MTVNLDNRVRLGGSEEFKDFDAVAEATITPGMLVEVTDIDADGTLHVQPHSTDGGAPALPLFADIVPYSGDQSGSTVPVEDDYASGDYVHVLGVPRFGRVNAILAAGADVTTASDTNAGVYDELTSAGDGTLRTTGSGGTGFAVVRDAVDNSGAAAGATARLITEVE